MSSAEREHGAPDLSGWEPLLDAAVNLADKYPEKYRSAIVEAVLRTGANGIPRPDGGASAPGYGEDQGSPSHDGLRAVAESADVDLAGLRRIVRTTDEGELELLARVRASSTAEKCRKAAVVYAYLQEKALGRLDIDIEELREVAKRQGAYDSPNFTRHLRAEDLLLEMGESGSSQKEYRLSPTGEQAAEEFIRELVEQ